MSSVCQPTASDLLIETTSKARPGCRQGVAQWFAARVAREEPSRLFGDANRLPGLLTTDDTYFRARWSICLTFFQSRRTLKAQGYLEMMRWQSFVGVVRAA